LRRTVRFSARTAWFFPRTTWILARTAWLLARTTWFSARTAWFLARTVWFFARTAWFLARTAWFSARTAWFFARTVWFLARTAWFFAETNPRFRTISPTTAQVLRRTPLLASIMKVDFRTACRERKHCRMVRLGRRTGCIGGGNASRYEDCQPPPVHLCAQNLGRMAPLIPTRSPNASFHDRMSVVSHKFVAKH